MDTGISFIEILSFFRTLGFAVSGAAALWGIVFALRSRRRGVSQASSLVYEWVARRLAILIYGGVLIGGLAYTLLILIVPVFAHEGVTIIPDFVNQQQAYTVFAPLYILWIALAMWTAFFRKARVRLSRRGLSYYYLTHFVITAVLISFPAFGETARESIFLGFHGFHSLFTLGTVLTLDFLFITCRKSATLQEHVFPFFPYISKIIWIGLGLDLLSTLFIYPEYAILEPRFLFAQTVVGILVINGTLLSGPFTRKILNAIRRGGQKLSRKMFYIMSFSGSVSVVSWLSITFVDNLAFLVPSYFALMGAYVAIILLVFGGHYLMGKVAHKEPSFVR